MRATQDAQRSSTDTAAIGDSLGSSQLGRRLVAFASAAAAMHALAAIEPRQEPDEEALLAILKRSGGPA